MRHDRQKHNRRSMRLKGYDYAQAGAYFVTICTHRRVRFFQNDVLYRIAAQCWQAMPEHASSVELDEWVIMPDHIHGIIVIIDSDDTEPKGRDDHDAPLRTGVQLNAPPTSSFDRNDLLRTGVQLNARPSISNDLDDPLRTGVQLNAPPTKHKDPQRHTARHAEPASRDPTNRFSVISPHRDTLAVIVRTYKAAVTTLCRRAGFHEFGWQRNYHERIIRTEVDLNRVRQYIIDNPSNWQ